MIKEAQVLRYRVFAQEMGAELKTKSEGLDYDDVDSYCEHLIVYDNCNKKLLATPDYLTNIRQNCWVDFIRRLSLI